MTDSETWKPKGDPFWIELLAYVLLVLYLFRQDVRLAFGEDAEEFDPGQPQARNYDYDRER